MIHQSNSRDESRQGGRCECWCLHGNVGLASDWRGLTDHLAQAGVASRAVDLWRFLCCDALSLEQTAVALNAEAEAANGLPKVLIGYSLGGRIALHALLAAPQLWQAAVLISAHPGLESAAERSARAASDATWATRAFSADWSDFLREWNSQPILAPDLPRSETDQRRLMARRNEIARGFVSWSLASQAPLWDALPELPMPVLWLAGADDPRYCGYAQRAGQLNPRFERSLVAGTGHRCLWQDPEVCHHRIEQFLAAHIPALF